MEAGNFSLYIVLISSPIYTLSLVLKKVAIPPVYREAQFPWPILQRSDVRIAFPDCRPVTEGFLHSKNIAREVLWNHKSIFLTVNSFTAPVGLGIAIKPKK